MNAAQQQAARSVVMGTAGHIDHGKTALVLALTGTDTDRLPEEKTRGITIDLGFASLDLKDKDGRTVHLGLVDVPGHQAFIHNMLAGAGGIDCVTLVVAATEGVKAQTEEHLAICSLLGVRHGVIALTKADAVSAERLEEARLEVRNFVAHSFLENAPLIAVSAHTGQGIDDLKQALIAMALSVPEHSQDPFLRLPLDRAFSVPGFGTVVTGTLRDGTLTAGDTVEIQPGNRVVRVRGIQVHKQSVREAHAPSRAALNLAGVEVGDLHRGQMIVPQGKLQPVSVIDVELTVVPGARAIKHRGRLSLHAFASESPVTVLRYDNGAEENATTLLARLKLRKPMVLVPGDRFVLRLPSPSELIGGGRVLDAHPLPRWRKAVTKQWLEPLRTATLAEQLLKRVERRGIAGVSLPTLESETGLRSTALLRALQGPMSSKQVVATKVDQPQLDRFLTPDALKQAAELIHKELKRKDARVSTRAELLSRTRLVEWVFGLAMNQLTDAKRIRVEGAQIVLNEAGAGAQSPFVAKVEEVYRAAGLASPLVSEVATALKLNPKDLPPLITQLLRSGKLVRMGSDTLMIHADALAKLKADLAPLRGQTIDVGKFKDLTGLTRKHAIPVLEWLDRMRITANLQGVRKVL